ncbi:Gfo/Idh/MocA family protein [Paracoccus zhejiangensis]|uniref:Galactose 1-dehydrogenase n=1 Tax=Paracoccus zhejiangensis TaxID=1077935 RepID=A0A2H5EUG2_9RHOB|nr:Gfo/Idh/MocA family oxidoreductase [Paracoccus zhejiangensis]AUH62928.1 galactose 1-dehydrogenase [Paracoccus zhejiangensis]
MTATDIAIIGLGKIATDQHVPAIRACRDFRLAATVSLGQSLPDVPAYEDMEAMFAAHPGVAAVALCVPPQVRYPLAVESLKAGRDVLLEKPPGVTLAEVEALRALAERQGCVLYATWHSRHANGVDPARDWLAARRVTGGKVIWREDVKRWHPGQAWIWQPGGMGVFDPGINATSILTHILPDPVRVTRAEFETPANCETPIAARLSLLTGEDAVIDVDFDFRETGEQVWSMWFDTDAGRIELSGGGARTVADGRLLSDGAALESEYARIYDQFAGLIADRRSDVDLSPMTLVADAFMLARHRRTDEFHDEQKT